MVTIIPMLMPVCAIVGLGVVCGAGIAAITAGANGVATAIASVGVPSIVIDPCLRSCILKQARYETTRTQVLTLVLQGGTDFG